ncbi:MAG TPA: DMT family transporter [Verrucomicrobiae bacterium]|nr:DMT family transporter [Verrucomicrobiae bacterium]
MALHWITASLLSALFIGVYDLCSKHAVEKNAVLPVLFWCTFCGAAVWTTLMAIQRIHPGSLPAALVTDPLSITGHLQLALKSAIVAAAWMFSYFGIKHLPMSLSAPIRSTGPLWTLCGALLILSERPSLLENLGILTTLLSFIALSFAGRLDGVHFHKDRWVGYLILGTVLNAISAVYDKYLLGKAHLSVPTVQAWYSVYMFAFFLPAAIGWKRRWWTRHEFQWRWTIPFIALSLLAADYVYFGALRNPHALVAVVISLRRGSTIIAFAGAVLLFHEKYGWHKLPAVIGILVGIVLTILG